MSSSAETETTEHLGSTTLAQVAIVVRDIEEASRRWATVLGVPVPGWRLTVPGLERHQTYRGEPSAAQAKLAFFDLGDQVRLELIEPVGEDGESTWHEALRERGEGVHHIAFRIEGMQRRVDFLHDQGIPLVQRGDMGEGQYAYFDAQERLGVVLELLESRRDSRAHP